jgi:hypothetical protein
MASIEHTAKPSLRPLLPRKAERERSSQAIARDIFMGGMLRAGAGGYPVVIRVHDELVCETRRGVHRRKLSALMTRGKLVRTLPAGRRDISAAKLDEQEVYEAHRRESAHAGPRNRAEEACPRCTSRSTRGANCCLEERLESNSALVRTTVTRSAVSWISCAFGRRYIFYSAKLQS